MVFSSVMFLFVYLVLVLGIYFVLPRRARNVFLLIVSLFFYAWGEPKLVFLMILSIVLNWVAGFMVDNYLKKEKIKSAKITLALFMAVDIAFLVFYKYTGFLFENVNALFGTVLPLSDFFKNIVMPIGISFYTFQMMSYVIDVYRRDTEVQKNIIDFGCYVSLFPQLIAGPIVQYKTIAKQLKTRRESLALFSQGAVRFIIGLSKKVFIANSCGFLSETIYKMDYASLPALTAFLGALAFSFQIYFDFSGYSDMAIGLGKMMGFEFLENFNYPYISKSVTDFWRRWHISLSTWFRDYVYITLGGNRNGRAKQIRNIAVVWVLTGIWHGASWNFVLWGAWFGVLLILEKLFLLKLLSRLPKFVGHAWALLCAYFGWVIFSHDKGFGELFDFVRALFGKSGVFADSNTLWILSNYALLFVIAGVSSTPLVKNLWKKIEIKPYAPVLRVVCVFGLFFLCIAFTVASTYNPFIYFRF